MTTQDIEFIGFASTQEYSEAAAGPRSGPVVDPDYLDTVAKAHEDSGFDRVLIAHSSSSPDGFVIADQVLSRTTRLGVLLAHRPGFLAPTLAARAYATLDAFHPGRIALHVITGGDDADQQRDGDFADKPTRYARTDDFLSVVRQEWESEQPFDHDGEFYRVKGAWSSVRPKRPIPVYFGGASEDAIRVGGKHADVYAFWGEPLEGIRERIEQVRAAAAPHGRDTRFSVSLRPIVAETEEEAWARAQAILERTQDNTAQRAAAAGPKAFNLDHSQQRGSQRLLEYAAQGDVHDKRLWTAVAKVTGAAGNSTALVGSYEQVADSLLDYVDLGVSTLLIRGFDPLADARDYGRVIDLVRAGVKARGVSGLEFIGIAATQEVSETTGPNKVDGIAAQTEAGTPVGDVVNPAYVEALARAHESSGFDRVLIAHTSAMPDGFIVADQILRRTERLGVLLAHRPGFLAPTLAARAYATLEKFHPGRVAMHVITGGDDVDQQRDGDFADKATRYARTDDFLTVVRQEWESETVFDHEGDFYRVKGGWSSVRPQPPIPVYFGGASEDAIRVGGKHADVYAFWGEPLDGIRERIRQVREAAAPYGRDTRFSVSLRPIVAETEEEAWARAEDILAKTEQRWDTTRRTFGLDGKNAVGSQRLLDVAAKGDLHDKRLWTAIAKVTGATGNSTALVGSYEQVADSLLDYVDLGVSTLLIRGFEPLADAYRYGRLVSLVREGARDRQVA